MSHEDALRLAKEALRDIELARASGSFPHITARVGREESIARAFLSLHSKCERYERVVVAARNLVAANKLHEAGGTNPLKRAADSTVLGRALTAAIDALDADKERG